MQHDRQIQISVSSSRSSISWQRQVLMWSDFVQGLQKPRRTTETFDEYIHMPKGEQGVLKDVGGFVGGILNGPRRKANAVAGRDLVTLDLDTIPTGETSTVLKRLGSLGVSYVVYSTRSHAPWQPRLRVIFPLDRMVSIDEYEPIARRMAAAVGIEMCDPTTFEACRLMYWPSCSKDSEYIYDYADLGFTLADGILGQYGDWHDVQQWPTVPGKELQAKKTLSQQADPTTKPGAVGAFCRVYDIRGALARYLPAAYEDTAHADRMTYTGGSTVAGAVLYEDGKFLYSHHATDPCCDTLVNAFDLVRMHKFADLDDEVKPGTPINRLPSYQAMVKLALSDPAVAADLNQRQAEDFHDIFDAEPGSAAKTAETAPAEDGEDGTAVTAAPLDEGKPAVKSDPTGWMKSVPLKYTGAGRLANTIDNIIQIMDNDPSLKGRIATDDFANRGMVLGPLPWAKRPDKRLWTDTDDAGLNWYMEARYGITGRDRITLALMLISDKHRFNDVKDYLEGLNWDGVPRVGTALVDYLGAEDSPYIQAVARKSFAAAVARVETPGCKYDFVPVFVGPQGIGKTTFLKTVGKEWHSDSLQSFKGKEAAEMIQGIWINEIGEMTGYNKSEDDVIKQFLSRCDDVYRQPYGRHTGRYPRKGVFFGTCNNHDFLKDPTGSRRFWPVDAGVRPPKKDIWRDLPGEVDQLWAEAVQLWREGEPLYMDTPELDAAARAAQDQHREDSVKEGVIRDFIEKEVPSNYQTMPLATRRMFWAGSYGADDGDLVLRPREKVCALEVWCECFGGDPKNMRRVDAMEISQILAATPGWRRNKDKRRYGYCGMQRGFERNL